MTSQARSWMGDSGKIPCAVHKEEKTAQQREVVARREQREGDIYTSGESPSKVSGMLRGPLNFETWIPSSHEIWKGKAFITADVSALFHLSEEIQDRFL